MRITEAARRLGMSPRMLRYREALGLLPPVRSRGSHRRFGPEELSAVAQGVELERRFDVSPAELAFGLRVLSDPAVAQAVRDLGLRIGRLQAPRRALDFEKEKALRLLQGRPTGTAEAPPQGRPTGAGDPRKTAGDAEGARHDGRAPSEKSVTDGSATSHRPGPTSHRPRPGRGPAPGR